MGLWTSVLHRSRGQKLRRWRDLGPATGYTDCLRPAMAGPYYVHMEIYRCCVYMHNTIQRERMQDWEQDLPIMLSMFVWALCSRECWWSHYFLTVLNQVASHSVYLVQPESKYTYVYTDTYTCKYLYARAYLEHLLNRTDGGTGSNGLLHSVTSNTLFFSCPDPCSLCPGTSNKRKNWLE